MFFFISCRLSRADDSNAITPLGVYYYQATRLVGDPVNSTSIFKFAVIGVGKCQCPSIAKDAHRLVKRYTVFRQVACRLLIVPSEIEHAKYLKGLTLALTPRAEAGGVSRDCGDSTTGAGLAHLAPRHSWLGSCRTAVTAPLCTVRVNFVSPTKHIPNKQEVLPP